MEYKEPKTKEEFVEIIKQIKNELDGFENISITIPEANEIISINAINRSFIQINSIMQDLVNLRTRCRHLKVLSKRKYDLVRAKFHQEARNNRDDFPAEKDRSEYAMLMAEPWREINDACRIIEITANDQKRRINQVREDLHQAGHNCRLQLRSEIEMERSSTQNERTGETYRKKII